MNLLPLTAVITFVCCFLLFLACCTTKGKKISRARPVVLMTAGDDGDGLPVSVDLRISSCFPYVPAENQGSNESCVAFSFAAALYCAKAAARLATLPDSGLGFPNIEELFRPALAESSDARHGVSFGSVVKRLYALHGTDLQKLGIKVEEIETGTHAVVEIRQALAQGSPVVAGYQVDRAIDSFHRSAKSCANHGYLLPRHSGDHKNDFSAHAVLLVGYDDRVQCFIARNSWGPDWGVSGHFLIRYRDVGDPSFFTDFAFLGARQRGTSAF